MICAVQELDATQHCTLSARYQKAYPRPAITVSTASTGANVRPEGSRPIETLIEIVFIS